MRLDEAWTVLDDPAAAPVPDLVAALSRVAREEAGDRWPWLAPVPGLSRHPDIAVRVAALRALRGCTGLAALDALGAGLTDGELPVRMAAVDVAADIFTQEAGVQLTALCAADPAVRRDALERSTDASTSVWVRCLADEALAPRVVARLKTSSRSLLCLGALDQHHRVGHLSEADLCGILAARSWAPLLEALLKVVPRQSMTPSVRSDPGSLDQVLRSAGEETTLERMLAVLARGGEEACAAALGEVVDKAVANQLPAASIVALGLAIVLNLALREIEPPPTQRVLALLFAPALLSMDLLTPADRRETLRRLAPLEPARQHPAGAQAKGLLELLWEEERLDLSAMAGLQRLFDMHPMVSLAAGPRRAEVMQALARDPLAAAGAFASPKPDEQRILGGLLLEAGVAHGHVMAPLLGLTLARVPELQPRLVQGVAPDSLLAAALIHADQRAGLNAEGGDGLARVLVEKGRRVDDLLREMLLATDRPGPVLVPLLRLRAARAKPRPFVARLGEEGCARMAALDTAHPMLIGTLAARLAKAMPTTWDDPVLAEWRRPLQPAPPDPMLDVPAEAAPREVDKTKAFRLRTCRVEALDKVTEFALASRARGLCGLLLARKAPPVPMPRVCLAALLSDDPPAEIALVLARYGGEDPAIAATLQRILVARYQHRALSASAAAWLHCWDVPRTRLAALIGAREGGLAGLLHESLEWQGPALRRVWWQAGARLVQQWRARDRARVSGADGTALAALAVGVLTERPAGGRGLLGFPASSRDLATVQGAAARMLVDLQAAGVDLSGWRDAVTAVLPVLDRATRTWISPWLVSALPPPPPRVVEAAARVDVAGLAELVEERIDLAALRTALAADERGAVELAVTTLLGRGDTGRDLVLDALGADPIAWPRELYQALLPHAAAVDAARVDAAGPAAGRYFLAVLRAAGLPEGPDRDAATDAAIQAALQVPGDTLGIDAVPLLGLGRKEGRIAERLVQAEHPTLWQWAARILCKAPISYREALLSFLDARGAAEPVVTAEVAGAIGRWRPELAWPWLATRLMTHPSGLDEIPSKTPERLLLQAIEAAMVGGYACVPEDVVVGRAQALRSGRSPGLWEAAALHVVRQNRDPRASAALVPALSSTRGRYRGTRRVAQVFRWGRLQGLLLLGKRYTVHTTTRGLGWTRLNERKVFVNPTAILRGERDGEALVRGLVVHELGHHRYNTDAEGQAANAAAQREGTFRLLNLVQDEHLERNLRSLDDGWGDDLKKLAAWAFQHAQRSEPQDRLDRALGPWLVPALVQAGVRPARERNAVIVQTGALLGALERSGSDFAAFVRALRMGRGSRGVSPRVAEALALFKQLPDGRPFREAGNNDLLIIARELQRIFGSQCDQLESFDLHGTADGSEGDDLADGQGVTDQAVQDEVIRLDKVQERGEREQRDGPPRGGGPDVLVTGPDADFHRIKEVRALEHDPAAAAALAAEVARPARLLRDDLAHLGLSTRVVKPRIAGHRLDRARLPALAVRRDPRVLQRRTRVIDSDLFVGIVVDCSGSMHGARMHRARRMAAVVAEACRPLDGVDARIFGFTDRIIWDAGSDRRCAAHALVANGGNNDAAGLYHAAQVALRSPRSAKLLVMISDGLPTECTTTALRTLVKSVQRRYGMVCAQVAVHSLSEQCFDHYVEVLSDDVDTSVRQFGRVVSKLVRATLSG